MLTASHFKLFRNHCPQEFKHFLKLLGIREPNFETGDEYKIYEELDLEIESKLKQKMRSKTIIEGYSKLLIVGNIAHDKYDSKNRLLELLITHQDSIFAANISVSEAKFFKFERLKKVVQDLLLKLNKFKQRMGFIDEFNALNKEVNHVINAEPILITQKFNLSKEAKLKIKAILKEDLGEITGQKIVISLIKNSSEEYFSDEELKAIFEPLNCMYNMFEQIK